MPLKEFSALLWTQSCCGHCMGSGALVLAYRKPSNIRSCSVPCIQWRHHKIVRISDSCWSSPTDWVDNSIECFFCPHPSLLAKRWSGLEENASRVIGWKDYISPNFKEHSLCLPWKEIPWKAALQASDHVVRETGNFISIWNLEGNGTFAFSSPLAQCPSSFEFLSLVQSGSPKAVASLSHSGSMKTHILLCEYWPSLRPQMPDFSIKILSHSRWYWNYFSDKR